MLKLERVAKSDQLNVLLRSKPKILTRPFVFALTYAIFFHLLALFVFQIAPLKINYGLSVFPPVKVATEIPSLSRVYVANNSSEEESVPSYLIAPLLQQPLLASLQSTPLVKNTEYIKQNSPLSNPFLSLEQIYEGDSHLMGPPTNTFPLVQLSGSIAGLPFKSHELKMVDDLLPSQIYHFLFSVQLDPKNGELFWWNLKEGDSNLKAQRYAVDILKNLNFEPMQDSVPLSGEIALSIVLSS